MTIAVERPARSSFSVLCFAIAAALALGAQLVASAQDAAPKPRVLILGDSISIGYTPFVREMLAGEAEVVRPMTDADRPENCAGTTNGVKGIDRWLAIGGGGWSVIHFNFGLHDLKRVDADTGRNSDDATDPPQATTEQYAKQLGEIVAKLEKTGARLILATTTPVPEGDVRPHRDPKDVARYNAVAVELAKKRGIAIDDLYTFALPRLEKIQRPVNVHFTDAGSRALAGEVVRHVRAALASPKGGTWVDLFDGKTLAGWTQRNGTATYRVEGDTIVGKTTEGSPNSFLCTDKEYGDFELTFEVKVDSRLNSGVQIRSQTRDGPTGRVNGPQVEIEAGSPSGSTSGYVYGEAAGGWMTPEDKLIPHKHFKAGEWNAYRVLAVGPNIKVWINGHLISDLTHEEKFKSHPKGFIGLQVHGIGSGQGPFEVAWRTLRLRDIGS